MLNSKGHPQKKPVKAAWLNANTVTCSEFLLKLQRSSSDMFIVTSQNHTSLLTKVINTCSHSMMKLQAYSTSICSNTRANRCRTSSSTRHYVRTKLTAAWRSYILRVPSLTEMTTAENKVLFIKYCCHTPLSRMAGLNASIELLWDLFSLFYTRRNSQNSAEVR